MGPQEIEKRMIHFYRLSISLYHSDARESTHARKTAYDLLSTSSFDNIAEEWKDKLGDLCQKMDAIYRQYTPKKKGHYVTKHYAVGYSSFPRDVWVEDKIQPPSRTTEEQLIAFDNLIEAYKNGGGKE